MPSHKLHRRVDRLILKKSFPKVHIAKDWPYVVLGPRHRILFHDMTTNFLIGLLYGREAFISACLHDSMKRRVQPNVISYLVKRLFN